MLEIIWSELTSGLPDRTELAHVVIRLVAALVLGAIVGYEREQAGKAAGLRTHMLVAMGTALFVLAASGSGMNLDGVSRVIQGLATGIGFIGAGAILKLSATREIQGLTTAAGIWVTAAIGVTVGLGALGLALLGTILTWIVLVSIGLFEKRLEREREKNAATK
ncbi:MAG: magnesium transporter MgtC [Gammaproteobacteria bacterium RIFCSPHIGHO2_12_FULL_63_22]|nr:MAG: magnesium transporter MgtC [Gammaproteobacteria bacterium RIFCSPHIGHO2_12_FULL_63_22]